MPNRTEARSAKAALTNATGRLPLLRLFSTLLKICPAGVLSEIACSRQLTGDALSYSTSSRPRSNGIGMTLLVDTAPIGAHHDRLFHRLLISPEGALP